MDDLRDSAIRCLNWLYLIGLEVIDVFNSTSLLECCGVTLIESCSVSLFECVLLSIVRS